MEKDESDGLRTDRFDECFVLIWALALLSVLSISAVGFDAFARSGRYLPAQGRMISSLGLSDLALVPPASISGNPLLRSRAVDLRYDPVLPSLEPEHIVP